VEYCREEEVVFLCVTVCLVRGVATMCRVTTVEVADVLEDCRRLPEDCRRNLKYRRRRSHVSMIDCLSCARSSNDVLAAAKDIWRTAEGGLSELLRVE